MLENAYAVGEILEESLLDEYECMDDVIYTFNSALKRIGIKDEMTRSLAYYLYATYTSHQNLLFIGTNGNSLANLISKVFVGKSASILNCEKISVESDFEELEKKEKEVIILKNIFKCDIIEQLVEYTEKSQHFFIVVYPFAEDLVIEPKSFFNFFWPIMTDLFVNNYGNENVIGGKVLSSFNIQKDDTIVIKNDTILNSLGVGEKTKNNIIYANELIKMNIEEKKCAMDIIYYLSYFSYAYVTAELTKVEEVFRNTNDISIKTREIILGYLD